MEKLSHPQKTIEIIKKYDFVFQKKFGQNFLIDAHVLEKIMNAAKVGQEDIILEIGPGIGTMTQYLAERAKKVIAVEIDAKLIPILKETLSKYHNVTILNQDILKLDFEKFFETYLSDTNFCADRREKIKVVANLPYYITTPIIMQLFESELPIENMTVMVQKEVALRMQAKPGGKDYGALSLAVQYYAKPYIAANVPANCFMPRPKVGSAVICLSRHEKKPVQIKDEKFMFKLIRASFNQRRKTLQNALVNSGELNLTKEAVAQALKKLGLPPKIRGERLTLEQFAALSDALL